jgi:probable DNA repair protein
VSTPHTSTEADLLALLSAGETVLLSNPRAARQLRSTFDQHQRERNTPAWEPPAALAWPQWTGRLYAALIVSGAETRILLNAAQQHLLWRNTIAADPPPGSLSSLDSLAELAASAFNLAANYDILNRLRSVATTPDTQAFARWSEAFLVTCRKQSYLPAALLDQALAEHTIAHRTDLPSSLHLAGFPDLTPAQQTLLTALEARSTTIHHHTLQAHPAQPATLALAANPREELLFAAQWTRHYLEAHGSTSRVAILTPSLSEDRDELEAVLRDVLAPELHSIHADLSSTPWHFSSGAHLASLPILATALSVAQLALAPLPLTDLSALLLSPYLCTPSDRGTTAQFDAQVLRQAQLLRPELTLSAFLDLAASSPRSIATTFRATSLFANLRNLHIHLQRTGDLTKPRTYAAWTDALREILTIAGWPAPQLNPSDFAATQSWEGALDTVATLDITGQTVPFATALEALHRQLTATSLTPPPTNPPVQVMSIAESLGTTFDAVLFLRATDAHWPPPEHPHPLLPFALQRSAAMPGTDPAATITRARTVTNDLIARSSTVLFTASSEDADGHLRPSALITELGLTPVPPTVTAIAALPLPLETVSDTAPLPPLPSPHIPGGASVLQSQAACGFRAFASFRLHAKELDAPDLGFGPPEAGQHLHRALQLFWGEVQSQQALLQMLPETLNSLLKDCAQQAITRGLDPRQGWDAAYLALQQQRLTALLRQWLLCEAEQRGPFTVAQRERGEQITLGPLTLDLRFDRVDHVGAGDTAGLVLVDYKTGQSGHPADWDGERPDDPQLPLYALAQTQPSQTQTSQTIQALTFARIRAGEFKWLGLQAQEGILPPSRTNQVADLPTLIEGWRQTLTALAEDFADGHAHVAPKDFPGTCSQCGQRLLCRVDPATRPLSEDLENPETPSREAPGA